MRNGFGSWNGNGWLAVLAASLLWVAPACGDDDSNGSEEEEDEPRGEECPNPGRTETGCTCSADRPPGYRQCTETGIWTACTCPPARPENSCDFEGQEVRCWPCSGETEGRRTECPASLIFDCSCRDGSVPLPRDAGDRDGG